MSEKESAGTIKIFLIQSLIHIGVTVIAFFTFFSIAGFIPNPSVEGIMALFITVMLLMAIIHFAIGNRFYKEYYGETYTRTVFERRKVDKEQRSADQSFLQTEKISVLTAKLVEAENTIEDLKQIINNEAKLKSSPREQRISSCEYSVDKLMNVYVEIYCSSQKIFYRYSKFETFKGVFITLMVITALFVVEWLVYLWVTTPDKVSNEFIEKIFTPLAGIFMLVVEYYALKIVPNNHRSDHTIAEKKYEIAQNNCALLKTKLAAIPTCNINDTEFNYKMEQFCIDAGYLLSEIKKSG